MVRPMRADGPWCAPALPGCGEAQISEWRPPMSRPVRMVVVQRAGEQEAHHLGGERATNVGQTEKGETSE